METQDMPKIVLCNDCGKELTPQNEPVGPIPYRVQSPIPGERPKTVFLCTEDFDKRKPGWTAARLTWDSVPSYATEDP